MFALQSIWDNLPLSLGWLANSYSSCKALFRVTSPTKAFSMSPAPPHIPLRLEDSPAPATRCSEHPPHTPGLSPQDSQVGHAACTPFTEDTGAVRTRAMCQRPLALSAPFIHSLFLENLTRARP